MNKVIFLLLVLGITVSVTFLGCSKSNTSNTTYSMSAQIGPNTYATGNCLAKLTGTTMLINGLSGSSNDPTIPYLQIAIPNWQGVLGQYTVDSFPTHPHIVYYTSATTSEISMYGVLTINSVTTTLISGTFLCTTKDTVNITSGLFTASVFK